MKYVPECLRNLPPQKSKPADAKRRKAARELAYTDDIQTQMREFKMNEDTKVSSETNCMCGKNKAQKLTDGLSGLNPAPTTADSDVRGQVDPLEWSKKHGIEEY